MGGNGRGRKGEKGNLVPLSQRSLAFWEKGSPGKLLYTEHFSINYFSEPLSQNI